MAGFTPLGDFDIEHWTSANFVFGSKQRLKGTSQDASINSISTSAGCKRSSKSPWQRWVQLRDGYKANELKSLKVSPE
jgi:hypothetical protein